MEEYPRAVDGYWSDEMNELEAWVVEFIGRRVRIWTADRLPCQSTALPS